MYYIIYDPNDHDYSIIDFKGRRWLSQDGHGWARSIPELITRLKENGFSQSTYSEFDEYTTLQDYLTTHRNDEFIIILEFSDLDTLDNLADLHPELLI